MWTVVSDLQFKMGLRPWYMEACLGDSCTPAQDMYSEDNDGGDDTVM